MKKRVITINNPRDDSMGASVKSLLEVLEQWSQISDKDKIIMDLTGITFVHPFFILPVCILISQKHEKIDKIKLNSKIEGYLQTILFPSGFDAIQTENWKVALSQYSRKSFMPVCKIPAAANSASIREDLLTTFENLLLNQLNLKGQIISVIKYIISEAIDNISEHAGVCAGWIMVQNYPQKGYLDICIADNGRGILGSYKQSGIPNINNDATAIQQAINGQSTKQITETRGYGIDTSRRMLVEGLFGKYLLLSGKAFYINTNEIEQIYNLPDFGWQGTMLALQIPGNVPENFNYTTYLE